MSRTGPVDKIAKRGTHMIGAKESDMMGRRNGQIGMQIIDIEAIIPGIYPLRRIDRMVRFDHL